QILPDGRHAASDADVFSGRGLLRAFQCFADAARHEVKSRASFHGEVFARMMRQHKYRHVIGRVVAPPALPAFVAPIAADRPEHVAAEDPGADIFESPAGEL